MPSPGAALARAPRPGRRRCGGRVRRTRCRAPAGTSACGPSRASAGPLGRPPRRGTRACARTCRRGDGVDSPCTPCCAVILLEAWKEVSRFLPKMGRIQPSLATLRPKLTNIGPTSIKVGRFRPDLADFGQMRAELDLIRANTSNVGGVRPNFRFRPTSDRWAGLDPGCGRMVGRGISQGARRQGIFAGGRSTQVVAAQP